MSARPTPRPLRITRTRATSQVVYSTWERDRVSLERAVRDGGVSDYLAELRRIIAAIEFELEERAQTDSGHEDPSLVASLERVER